jgi:hypothetical protein
MLCEKNDSQTYIREFQKRFNNFAEKAPILISYSISPDSVSIIDEGKDIVYKFDWDYTIPIKSFIHGIKEVLSEKSYPSITRIIEENIPLSEKEAADLIAEGVPIHKIPSHRTKIIRESYLIDKCIVFKDTFILKNMETNELYRYKLNKSSVFFLKKLRQENLSKVEAGSYFFKNAELLNKIEKRNEDES